MMRPVGKVCAWHLLVALVALALSGVFAAGCGADEEADPNEPDSAPATAERAQDQGPGEQAPKRDAPRATNEAGDDADETPAERPSPGSKESRRDFNAAVDQLPIGTGELPIAQYITSQSSDNVVARLRPKDFFCGRSVAERTAVVEAFYEQAAKRFRAAGADFRLTVAELTNRIDDYPTYARATEGSVSLTAVGRGTERC